MIEKLQHINKLPVPTWKWLHINDASMQWEEGQRTLYTYHPAVKIPEDIAVAYQTGAVSRIPETLKETADFVEERKNHQLHLQIPDGYRGEEPIKIEYLLGEKNRHLIHSLHIIAGKESRAQIQISYAKEDDVQVWHCGHTLVEAGSGSHIKIVQSQMLGSDDYHADAVQIHAAEHAVLEALFLELGSGKCAAGADIFLDGTGAKAELNSLYLGGGKSLKDLNYRISYAGRETQGGITVKGALSGNSEKTLKSTIDFLKGAAGAKGYEEEAVMVLSDGVKNISTPLLLCGEDHVEGEHATNIGRPDPQKLYYLMSRGFTEKEARKLLVEAGFTPLLNKLEDSVLKEQTRKWFQEVIQSD